MVATHLQLLHATESLCTNTHSWGAYREIQKHEMGRVEFCVHFGSYTPTFTSGRGSRQPLLGHF